MITLNTLLKELDHSVIRKVTPSVVNPNTTLLKGSSYFYRTTISVFEFDELSMELPLYMLDYSVGQFISYHSLGLFIYYSPFDKSLVNNFVNSLQKKLTYDYTYYIT